MNMSHWAAAARLGATFECKQGRLFWKAACCGGRAMRAPTCTQCFCYVEDCLFSVLRLFIFVSWVPCAEGRIFFLP